MEAGLSRLEEKRGVTLYQLPPHFPIDLDRLDAFLTLVPSGQKDAVEFRHPTSISSAAAALSGALPWRSSPPGTTAYPRASLSR